MAQIVKKTAAAISGLVKSKGINITSFARLPELTQVFRRRYSRDIPSEPWMFTENDINDNNEKLIKVECKEIVIPVPYGHVAAKVWGRDTGYPVLAFHGWLDNSGTFDKLFPLLSHSLYIVAIDSPGHGFSSHKPPGCYYRDLDMVIDFKRVFDHFGWQRCSIIGHSMGGGHALMFASLFPELVRKLVVLDIIKPTSRPSEKFPEETIKAISEHMEIEKKLLSSPPLYTVEEATKRLRKGMFNEVTQESAEILIKRATKLSDCGNGYIFSRDLRCRTIERFSRTSHETMLKFMSSVKCELLMIRANDTHENYKTATPEVIDDFIEIYRSNCKTFDLHTVNGNHFVHINNPENVAPLIDEFFSKRDKINLEIKRN